MLFFLTKQRKSSTVELAENYSVCRKTAYNDIMFLSRYAPIYTKGGVNGGVFLMDDYRNSMFLYLSCDEETEQQLYEDLHGVIFLNPEHEISPEYEPKYLTADEYLSGNVREKLSQAEQFSKDSSEYRVNAEYLEKVQPKDLTPGEISVKLGTTWIPEKYIEEFVFELLSPNYYAQSKIEVKYSNLTGEWNIQGKSADKGVKATNTYGTSRISAYKIIEDSLNLRDVRIFDYI